MSDEVYEIPCPSCGSTHTLAENELPSSGELVCSRCGEGIHLRASGERATAANPPEGGDQPGGAAPRAGLLRLEDWDAGGASAYNVTCPGCGHRFDPSTVQGARPTILVVEDTEFFLHLATEVLGGRYETLGVRTIRDALQVLGVRRIDLVLLDLKLEDGEGADLLRAMPRPGIPVLIYTSRDETTMLGSEWSRLRSLGASDIIHKGLNIEEALLQKVEDLLAQALTAG